MYLFWRGVGAGGKGFKALRSVKEILKMVFGDEKMGHDWFREIKEW